MKKILVILSLVVCFTSCKKSTTTPTPSPSPPPNNNCPTCPTNTNTAVGDTIWFSFQLEAPSTSTFTYKYDTLNTRVLLNGKRISCAKMNVSTPVGESISMYKNFAVVIGNETDYPIKMKSGDTLTFVIDSLMYTSNNITGDNPSNRGGYIRVGKTKPTNLTNYETKTYSVDNNAVNGNPTGRYLGVANANNMGGSGQSFTWYVGKKYVYHWIKP